MEIPKKLSKIGKQCFYSIFLLYSEKDGVVLSDYRDQYSFESDSDYEEKVLKLKKLHFGELIKPFFSKKMYFPSLYTFEFRDSIAKDYRRESNLNLNGVLVHRVFIILAIVYTFKFRFFRFFVAEFQLAPPF